MASFLEKVVLDFGFLPKVSMMLAGMEFVVKNCLTYFLREEIDSPPLIETIGNGVNSDI